LVDNVCLHFSLFHYHHFDLLLYTSLDDREIGGKTEIAFVWAHKMGLKKEGLKKAVLWGLIVGL